MAKLWKCPQCGKGRRAPSRMEKDDTRRYCLPCSADAPRLIRMECPVLENRRTKAGEKKRERARKEQEKNRQIYFLSDGTDTRVIYRRIACLKVWRIEGCGPLIKKHGPRVLDNALPWEPDITASGAALHGLFGLAVYAGRKGLSQRRSYYIEACAEFFGIERAEMIAHTRLTRRLKGLPATDATLPDITEAVRALIAHQGKEQTE